MLAQQIFYTGRVQGVGFRYQTAQLAAGYAVAGFVRNLDDGRVAMHIEGEEAELAAFLEAVRAHFGSYILTVEQLEAPYEGSQGFSVRR